VRLSWMWMKHPYNRRTGSLNTQCILCKSFELKIEHEKHWPCVHKIHPKQYVSLKLVCPKAYYWKEYARSPRMVYYFRWIFLSVYPCSKRLTLPKTHCAFEKDSVQNHKHGKTTIIGGCVSPTVKLRVWVTNNQLCTGISVIFHLQWFAGQFTWQDACN